MTKETVKRSVVFIATLMTLALAGGCPAQGPDSKTDGKSGKAGNEQTGKTAKAADLPSERPSVIRGKEIYLRNCAACHGAFGKGDGESAADLDPKPDDLTDVAFMRRHSPRGSFDIVTKGKDVMPSFKDSLSDLDRWDVVFYTMTLVTNPQKIAHGEEVYLKNCSACHGGTGKGDGQAGVELKAKPADFTDMERMSTKKSDDLFQSTTKGEESMPSFHGAITDEDIWDTIDYLWTFIYEQ